MTSCIIMTLSHQMYIKNHEISDCPLTSHTLTTRYHLSCVVFVADRGLFSEDNLQILEQSGLEYVVGAKLKTQARVIKGENSFTRSLPRAE